MLEIIVKIFNVFTIASILGFAAYLFAEAKDSRYHILGFYFCTLTFRYKPFLWMWRNAKINFFIYLIIPFLYAIALILLSQFYDDEMKIRWDMQVILTGCMWVIMIFKEKFTYDYISKLEQENKELKDKLKQT